MSRTWLAAGVAALLLVLALQVLFGGAPARLVDGEGRRVLVADGDTLTIWGETIRLADIDAVERAQFCLNEKGVAWSCGQSAKEALEVLVARGGLHCTKLAADRYGRTVARCRVRDADVAAALVSDGWAVAENDGYAAEEQAARTARRGIWAGTFEAPAVWRERTRVMPRHVAG